MNNRLYHLCFSEPGIRKICIEELSDFFAHSAMYEDYLKTDKIRIICGEDAYRWQVSFCIFVAASSKTHPNIKSVLDSLGYNCFLWLVSSSLPKCKTVWHDKYEGVVLKREV